jgi:hypothetical protein
MARITLTVASTTPMVTASTMLTHKATTITMLGQVRTTLPNNTILSNSTILSVTPITALMVTTSAIQMRNTQAVREVLPERLPQRKREEQGRQGTMVVAVP